MAGDVVTVSLVPARAQAQRTLYLDPSDGSVLREVGWEDYSALGKTVEWGVATHMGHQFGELNRWLMLSACVLVVLTIASGVVMWWRRRPTGHVGVPNVPLGQHLPSGLLLALGIVGVLLPLAGAALLLLAAGIWINKIWRGRRTLHA